MVEKLSNKKNLFFIEISLKLKLKHIEDFGCAFGILEKLSMNRI
jgi:hypothetical protein